MKKLLITLLLISMFILSFPIEVYAKDKPITIEEVKYEYINIDWWKDFNDEYLVDYIVQAIQCNKDLKLATLKVGEVTENKNIVRANEMPDLAFGVVPALYKLPAKTNSEGLISLPIYANYEIDLFAKNRDKTKSLDKYIEITRQQEKASYISVISAVGSVYYNIVKLDRLIELQEQIITDRKQIYELMKLSNDEGLVSAADTVQANQAYIKANSDILELKKSRERLLNYLCVLIGETPENSTDLKRISYQELVISKKIPDFITSEIIENRPDYIMAEKNIEKAGIDVRVAKKEFLPTFNILGLVSFNSTKYLSQMNWKNSVGLFAGSGLLPLFDGGKRFANLRLQKNKYEQAFENYEKTYLIAIQEVNDSLCDLKLDNEKYLKTLEIYKSAKEDFYYSNLKYKEGVISQLDLLQKKESLLTTEKRVVSDKTDYFINQIGLYKSTAGGNH